MHPVIVYAHSIQSMTAESVVRNMLGFRVDQVGVPFQGSHCNIQPITTPSNKEQPVKYPWVGSFISHPSTFED